MARPKTYKTRYGSAIPSNVCARSPEPVYVCKGPTAQDLEGTAHELSRTCLALRRIIFYGHGCALVPQRTSVVV